MVIQGQRSTHRESRDTEIEVNVPLYELNIDASRGCSLRYIYRTLLEDDVKLVLSCHFSLQTSNKNDVWEYQQKVYSMEKEDGFRATLHSVESSSCFLLPATEEITGENDWVTKTIDIPAVKEGSTLLITRLEMNVIITTSSLVGVSPQVIASLGYLSIIPPSSPFIAPKVEQKLESLSWKDILIQKVGSASNEEDMFRLFGTLNWTDTNNANQAWKETDYYLVSYEIDGDETTRLFLGTSFCKQYRVSGLDCINKLRDHRIVVQAVNKEGYISAKANFEIAFP